MLTRVIAQTAVAPFRDMPAHVGTNGDARTLNPNMKYRYFLRVLGGKPIAQCFFTGGVDDQIHPGEIDLSRIKVKRTDVDRRHYELDLFSKGPGFREKDLVPTKPVAPQIPRLQCILIYQPQLPSFRTGTCFGKHLSKVPTDRAAAN